MAILTDANDILVDLSGEVTYLQDTKLWIRDETDATQITATVTFNNSDLGVPSAEKLMNYIDVDYIGTFSLVFKLDGTIIHTIAFANQATRNTVWKDFPISKRKPFQKIQLTINSSVIGTKIYGLELDFEILRRRRYN